MFKVNNKDTRTPVVLVSLSLTLNIFHTCSSDFTVNFGQVNAGWELACLVPNYCGFHLRRKLVCIYLTLEIFALLNLGIPCIENCENQVLVFLKDEANLTIKTRHWRRSGVCIVNFEHILHIAIVFLLLTLNI